MDQIAAWLLRQRQDAKFRQLFPVDRDRDGHLGPAGKEGVSLLDFSSNDYLALSRHPEVVAAARRALEEHGAGAGAARLMSGDLVLHHRLEEAVARLKGKDSALLFGSGYLANIGIIPALVGRDDVIFADRLNHASIYDGCRLSGAELVRFRHNDLNHLEDLLQTRRGGHRALLLVESLYSMDGDFAPLRELVSLKERFDCLLMVDEAHATGVFGANGAGLIEQEGVVGGVDLAMGTFGKALGGYGAYIAAGTDMISYLINRARSFIFSTALPPAVAGAALAAIKIVQGRPELRAELHRRVDFFKQNLRGAWAADRGELGPSQIIPLRVGESDRALALADELRRQGIYATAVRPPTVPEGTARIRLSITMHLSEADLFRAAEIFQRVGAWQAGTGV